MMSFKENKIREDINPIDEAGYYFNILDLNEEQLFTEYDHRGAIKSRNDITCFALLFE